MKTITTCLLIGLLTLGVAACQGGGNTTEVSAFRKELAKYDSIANSLDGSVETMQNQREELSDLTEDL